MRFVLLCALAGAVAPWLSGQDLSIPERTIHGQTIVSSWLPAASLTFGDGFRYAGGQRFVLYNVADAEQHFFVDADAAGQIRRLYWIQFERYLPDNDHHYDYTPTRTSKIGPLSFIYDTKIFTDYAGIEVTPDSDSAKVRSLLAANGLKLPHAVMRTRMFHLPNPDQRSELMIIYIEAVPLDKLPAKAANDMPADDAFPELSADLLRRIKETLTITN